jgi:hypothetical protein
MVRPSPFERIALKSLSEIVAAAPAVILTSLALTGHAFTLGELRGTAIIGRALDVSVRVQASAGEEVIATCFSADIYHADALQGKPKVSVISLTPESLLVRIQSVRVVDEPVVSVELRSECGFIATRRYVLLADVAPVGVALPSDTLSSGQVVVAPVLARPELVANLVSPSGASRTGTRSASTSASAKPGAAKTGPQKTGASPSSTERMWAKKPRLPDRATDKAVLKLDPKAFFSDRIDALDSALLFAPTVDAMLQAQQIASLQTDIKVLRELAAKTDGQLRALKTELQQSQSQNIPVVWIYALGILVLTCLAALGWLLLQQRRTRSERQPTWHDLPEPAQASARRPLQPAPVTPMVKTTLPAKQQKATVTIAATAGAGSEAGPPVAQVPQENDLFKVVAASPPRTSNMEGIHSFSAEPILDIRQQAEFFVSLGQTERALQILKQQISSSAEPNPFIYLDLLALLHSLGMKADFREYRSAFNRFFTGVMPDFPAFHLEGEDLLAYPEVLEQLVQGWPSAQTLVLLDQLIFCNQQTPPPPSFELAAFRDLLMLHALAEEVATDLPWNKLPPAVKTELAAAPKDESSLISRVAAMASVNRAVVPPAKTPDLLPASQIPAMDIDFSNFETGSPALNAAFEAQADLGSSALPPPANAPRTPKPTAGKPR